MALPPQNIQICLLIIMYFKPVQPFPFDKRMKRFDTCIIPWKGLFRVAALHFCSRFSICLGYLLTASVTVDYLLDGRCSISNNIAENIARPYAVGRKNFLFHDTVKGARSSSIIYSLVETAKLNHLNIYAYLETVLLYMPDYKNEPEGIEELMPWSDMIQQRCRIKSKS